jgi:NADP-dependent 3-hydroxy acid dehydrogenase YdfG
LNLRADLVGKGINVTSLEPGLAETEFSIVRFKGDKEKASHVYKDTRFIKPEDIAETIYWVATRPKNININRIEIMAGDQAFNPFKIVKKD